jgi:hypothetical protein
MHLPIIGISIFFITISLVLGEHIPFIWPDEVLFFNPSIELSNHGILRTTVLSGLIPDMENHTLWMPPVYMILLSGVFKIFPQELFVARMFSSFISLASILVLYLFCKNLRLSKSRTYLVLLLVASDFVFLKFSHTARMESLSFLFCISSFYFLSKSFESEIPKFNLFFCGISISLSFLSHPFGIIHSLSILFFLYTFGQLKWRNFFIIALSGLLPILFWMVYIIPNFDSFLIQFGAQFSRKSELLGKFSYMDKIKIIFSPFPLPVFKIILFIFGLGCFFIVKKTKQNQFFLFWTLLLFFILLFTSESWYVLHLVVPASLYISSLHEEETQKKILILPLLIYNLATCFIFPIYFYKYLDAEEKIISYYESLAKEIEDKNKIYIQLIPDPYFYFKKKFPNKELLEFIPGELSPEKDQIPISSKDLPFWKRSYKLDPNYYSKKIEEVDLFLFYREDLINPKIKEYFLEHKDEFEIKFIKVEPPKPIGLKLEAIIYKRR